MPSRATAEIKRAKEERKRDRGRDRDRDKRVRRGGFFEDDRVRHHCRRPSPPCQPGRRWPRQQQQQQQQQRKYANGDRVPAAETHTTKKKKTTFGRAGQDPVEAVRLAVSGVERVEGRDVSPRFHGQHDRCRKGDKTGPLRPCTHAQTKNTRRDGGQRQGKEGVDYRGGVLGGTIPESNRRG